MRRNLLFVTLAAGLAACSPTQRAGAPIRATSIAGPLLIAHRVAIGRN